MNNQLAQKYQYYLNESNRLSEELQNEEEYSELLENILFKLLGEEDFTKLFEYVMKGTVTHDEHGNPLSPEKSQRRAKRIGQIVKIGRNAADLEANAPNMDDEGRARENMFRAALSIAAKGGSGSGVRGDRESRSLDVVTALRGGTPIKIGQGNDPDQERREREITDRERGDMSLQRRRRIAYKRDQDRNTF